MTEKNTVPQPNPALGSLDRLVGSWQVSDPTGANGISGKTSYEWLPGGFFLMQNIDFGDTKGIEMIGYDKESRSLKSQFFGASELILEYTYKIEGDILTISIEMPQAKGQFAARFSADGNSFTGHWDWIENGEKKGYAATLTRIG
jgi:hypothetical protein